MMLFHEELQWLTELMIGAMADPMRTQAQKMLRILRMISTARDMFASRDELFFMEIFFRKINKRNNRQTRMQASEKAEFVHYLEKSGVVDALTKGKEPLYLFSNYFLFLKC